MKKHLVAATGLAFLLVCFNQSFAADYYWGVSSGNWNNLSNWKMGSFTGSTATMLPTSSDNIFIGNGSSNATVTVNINDTVSSLTIQGSGQIFVNGSSFSLHLWGNLTSSNTNTTGGGTAHFKLTGTGSQYLTGNTTGTGRGKLPHLTIDKVSGTLYLADNITSGGSTQLRLTAGTVDPGTSRWMCYYNNNLYGNLKFHDLEFNGSAAVFDVNDSVTVLHNLYLSGSSTMLLRYSAINLYGDLIGGCSGSVLYGNFMGKVCFKGGANQTIRNAAAIPASTTWLPPVTFSKSAGTVYLRGGSISSALDWINDYSSTAINSDSATVYFHVRAASQSHTIGGTVTTSLKRVVFTSFSASCIHYFGTLATPALSVTDTFTVAGSNLVRFANGTVDLLGDVRLLMTYTGGAYSFIAPSFRIKGAVNQTVYGTSAAGSFGLTNLSVDKSAGTVMFRDYVACGAFSYVNGNVDFTTHQSTLEPYGTVTTRNGSGTLIPLYHLYINGFSALGSDVAVYGDITIAATGQFAPYNAPNTSIYYTVELKGNLVNNGLHTSLRTHYKITGTGNQTFGGSSSSGFGWNNLIVNKPSGTLTLQKPLTLATSLVLTKGIVYTDVTNLLTLNDNVTVNSATDSSHVNGPVKKIGNDAFAFPLGKSGHYRSLSITAPSSTTAFVTAEYFDAPQVLGTASDTVIEKIGLCEYWTASASSAFSTTVTVKWGAESCNILTDLADMRVARWDATQNKWVNLGNGGTTGTKLSGSVTAQSSTSTYGYFALAQKTYTANLTSTLQGVDQNTLGSIHYHLTKGKAPYEVTFDGVRMPLRADVNLFYYQNAIDTNQIDEPFYAALNARRYDTVFNDLTSKEYRSLIVDATGDTLFSSTRLAKSLKWLTTDNVTVGGATSSSEKSGNLVSHRVNEYALNKTGTSGWSTGFAYSLDWVQAGEPGSLEFQVAETGKKQCVGLVDAAGNAGGYADIKYGLYFENGDYKAVENGTLVSIGTFSANDRFALDFQTDENNAFKIYYKKNGVITRTSDFLATADRGIKYSAFEPNDGVLKFTVVGVKWNLFGVTISKTYPDCGANNGRLTAASSLLGVIGGSLYLVWKDADGNTLQEGYASTSAATLQNVGAGTYSLTASYGSFSGTWTVDVGNKALWKNKVNATIGASPNTNVLIRTSGTGDGGGGSSVNRLVSPPGWFQFNLAHVEALSPYTATSSFNNFTIGFAYADVDQTAASIDYKLLVSEFPVFSVSVSPTGIPTILYSGNKFWITGIRNVNPLPTPTLALEFQTFAEPGDLLKCMRTGNVINFFVNGIYKGQFNPVSNGGLVVDATPHGVLANTGNVICSFPCQQFEPYFTLHRDLDGGYYVPYGTTLKFKFEEEYHDPDASLEFSVFDKDNQAVSSSQTLVSAIGEGYYVLNLNALSSGSLSSGYYLLKVLNAKGEDFYLRFRMD